MFFLDGSVPSCSRLANFSRALRFRNILSPRASCRRRHFALAANSIAGSPQSKRFAAGAKSVLATRFTGRVRLLIRSPALLWSGPPRDTNFFSARYNQLARRGKSCGCFNRCSDYRGNIFPRTRSRRSAQNRTQVYLDLCNIGLVFPRSFFESAESNIAKRALDVGIQFNRERVRPICRSAFGRSWIHNFIFNRLDLDRRAVADSLALAADRFARRLDFYQRCVQ